MRKAVNYLFLILVVIFLTGVASASFSVGDASHSITNVYGPSEDARGWVNISLNNEPGDSLFRDSRGNSIELIELLEKDSRHSYLCNPTNCDIDYDASSGETLKTFNLNSGDSIIFGLRFSGSITNFGQMSFDITSDAPVSCVSQIEVDILDDGNVDVVNNKIYDGPGCSNLKNYGCYDPTETTGEYNIRLDNIPYCQLINVSESPGFYLGAWVKNVTGSLNLEMSIYDSFNTKKADCMLPEISGSGVFSCNVSYSVSKSNEHYVCIRSTGGTGNYKIKGYDDSSGGCGFPGYPIPTNSPPAAYEIFAEGMQFDAVETINIQDSLPNGGAFGALVRDYISSRYSNDCSNECVVPIRFISEKNQQINISNLNANYEKTTGSVTENRFYDVEEIPAEVTSGFQKIYIDKGGFSVPNNLGEYTFSLELDGTGIFSERVNVSDVPRILSLIPSSTASAFPTEFTVNANSPSNITGYFWEFGDGDTGVTTTNKVTHTYSSIGDYQLKVSVTDLRGFSSEKIFEIRVNSPKDLINSTLNETKNNVDNINTYLFDLDFFHQQSLKSILNIDFVESELERLEIAYNNATGESEYNQIITDLIRINLPKSVTQSISAEAITFIGKKKNMDIGVLQAIGGGNYDSSRESEYFNAIASWNQENLETKMDFTEFSGEYSTFTEPILRIFEITINEKKDLGESYFLILPKLENLEFESSIVGIEEGDYVYVDLGASQKVSFSTTEDIGFTDLPAFISPRISSLSLTDISGGEENEKRSKLTIFILAISLLVIIAFITYVVLQEWYKKKYENYLFKNKNDLYNMVNYVNNSKKKGLKNKEISNSLKKAKWGSEQVKYVMKKYAGKRTGMFELPFTDLVTKLGKNNFQKRK